MPALQSLRSRAISDWHGDLAGGLEFETGIRVAYVEADGRASRGIRWSVAYEQIGDMPGRGLDEGVANFLTW